MSLLLDALRRSGSGSRRKDYGYLYSAEDEADATLAQGAPGSRPRTGSVPFKVPARRVPRWVWLAGGGSLALALSAGAGWYWLESASPSGTLMAHAPSAPNPTPMRPSVASPEPTSPVAVAAAPTPEQLPSPPQAMAVVKPAMPLPPLPNAPASATRRLPGSPKLSVSALSELAPDKPDGEPLLAPFTPVDVGQATSPSKQNRRAAKTTKAMVGASPTHRHSDAASPASVPMSAAVSKSELGFELANAWALLERGQWAEAEADYRVIIGRSKVPEPDAVLGLAVALHRQKRWGEALTAYETSLRVWPGNPVAASAMLDILAHTNATTAESRLKQWIIDRPQDAAAFSSYGLLLGRQANWPEAVGILRRARELEPANGLYAYNLAVGLDQTHRYAEAAEQYQAALRLGGIGGAAPVIKARLADIAQMVRP